MGEQKPCLVSDQNGSIDELDLALALRRLTVRQHPDVGGNAGVVEELFRQGDDGFEPVVLQNPAANFALTAARIPVNSGEPFMMIATLRAAFIDRLHVREHVLEK